MPVSSRKCCPPPAGSPSQRAASTRSTWPCANSATSPVDRARPGDHPIHPRAHLLRRLAARASIPEDQPVRRRLADLLGRQSLVLAVVPLDQVGLDDGRVAEARQLAGLPCPLQRADENERERLLGQHGPHPLGESTPVVGQRDVGRARVLPAQAPRGLPVPDRERRSRPPPPAQTLSASVEPTPPDAAACPHFQPVISGMSSPYRAMYSLCSISLLWIACLA